MQFKLSPMSELRHPHEPQLHRLLQKDRIEGSAPVVTFLLIDY
jgi:hypothetical protein